MFELFAEGVGFMLQVGSEEAEKDEDEDGDGDGMLWCFYEVVIVRWAIE